MESTEWRIERVSGDDGDVNDEDDGGGSGNDVDDDLGADKDRVDDVDNDYCVDSHDSHHVVYIYP